MSEETIGQRIKRLRKERRWTQQELADKIPVRKNTISQYETDTNKPDREIESKLADALGVSIDYLRGRSVHPEISREEEEKQSTDNLKKIRDLISQGKVTFDDGTPMSEAQINHIVQTLDLHLQTKENK